jgi:hypothetical protein
MKSKAKISKKFVACFVTLTMFIMSCGVSVFAADTTDSGAGSVTGTVGVTGAITPLTISVTHPVTVAYAIDPNTGSTTDITSPAVSVTNNTKVPVKVTVSSLTATSGGTLTFTDAAAASKTWSSLNAADSKKYISLGIKATSTGWNTGYSTSTFASTGSSPLTIGSLGSAATGTMSLVADHGLAFDSNYTANHNLVFKFELA